jgi:AcrR family transcriptional regulator
VPTGVALRDVREQLFDAAERILRRDGPNALTSRAVTTEAGVAKGVLHRHFDDFDDFLAGLVRDRAGRFDAQAEALLAAAGTGPGSGTVTDHITDALMTIFGSVALSIVALIIARDDLRARLRDTWPIGIPLLTEAATMLSAYLAAERDRGRIDPGADLDTLALTLIGTGHLLFADRHGTPPGRAAVRKIVEATVTGAMT